MRIPEWAMTDMLTIEVVDAITTDPTTGASRRVAREIVKQPCSDQDVTIRERARYLINGVAGSLPASRCYTAWFLWPSGEVVIKVNGRTRSLLRQGPADVGGQRKIYVLELDKPE